MENEFFEPREMGIPAEKRDRYTQLVEGDKASPYYGRPLKDVFMCALALGYKNQKREKLDKRRADIRFESLTPKEKWVIIAIAIKELGGVSPLGSEDGQRQIWQIAEEYAKGGIDILHALIYSGGYSGLAIKMLESEVRDAVEALKLAKD